MLVRLLTRFGFSVVKTADYVLSLFDFEEPHNCPLSRRLFAVVAAFAVMIVTDLCVTVDASP